MSPENRPVLDRLPQFDVRSRAYPIRALLTETTPRSYTWGINTWLDQGQEGACVGFAWAHELAAKPVPVRDLDEPNARAIYQRAQQLDQWDGEDYEGTSVIAGAKAVAERGNLLEYRWAFGLDDVLAAISRHGPVVLGVPWYSGMWDTDADGYIRPTGEVVGGHAILAHAVSVKRRDVTLHNSWGRAWGHDGRARIRWDDLALVLANNGEACVPVRRK